MGYRNFSTENPIIFSTHTHCSSLILTLFAQESYRQLKQRVESHVATFLSKQTWTDALPKNQVRDSLRKHINQ